MINILLSILIGAVPVLIASYIVHKIDERYDKLPRLVLTGLLVCLSVIMFSATCIIIYGVMGGLN